MPDLREHFDLAERLDVPDLWQEAVARASRNAGSTSIEPTAPWMGRRIAVAGVALLLFVAAAAFLWNAFSHRGSTAIDQPAPSSSVLDEGNARGVPWTLVAVGGDVPTGLELRWQGRDPGVESIEPESAIVVGWHHFGRFEPDDDVIFGIVPGEAVSVRYVSGYGLPGNVVNVIDVPGADWNAFTTYSYAAIGIVTARGPAGTPSWEWLIVPSGCESALHVVESFLAAREEGQGAEAFLTPGALRQFGRLGVAPLYLSEGGAAYVSSKVLFLDASTTGRACDAGVRLQVEDGTVAEDTLHIEETDGSEVISDVMSGITGP